jgi:hypothetical protein
MAATLEYGLYKDGRMLHITEVDNGLACGCVCPNPLCGQRLIARNNPTNIIALNFAHESGAECEGAKESELHRRAKQIICDHRRIVLPDQSVYVYESAKPEATVDKYRADVSLTGKSYPLLVEIVVTCEITEEKTYFLRQSGKRTLVIDLGDYPMDIDQTALTKILIEDWEEKSMIEPLPVKINSPGDDEWSFAKIAGVILLVSVTIFWAIPAFFKWLGKIINGKTKGKP